MAVVVLSLCGLGGAVKMSVGDSAQFVVVSFGDGVDDDVWVVAF